MTETSDEGMTFATVASIGVGYDLDALGWVGKELGGVVGATIVDDKDRAAPPEGVGEDSRQRARIVICGNNERTA